MSDELHIAGLCFARPNFGGNRCAEETLDKLKP